MRGKELPGKKEILSDPATLFREMHAEANDAELSMIDNLAHVYTDRKKILKNAQDRANSISRKIGMAKRSGAPVAPLIEEMHEHGSDLKKIRAELAATEDSILQLFSSGNTPSNDEVIKTVLAYERNYPAVSAPPGIKVSILGDDHVEWDGYARGNPAATIYHLAGWKDLIHSAFGHNALYLMARNETGKVVGILPLVRICSWLFGDFLVSMPYFNHGGAIADHPSIEKMLMQVANKNADCLGVSHVEYRDNIAHPGLPVSKRKHNMLLPLPESPQALWESFTPKLRAQIRRAKRENPRLERGGAELLDDFYAVFARNMRDLGTPVYGKSFFQKILQAFPQESFIQVVYLDNKPVAAGFLIGYADTLEIPWASTLRKFNHLSMNMLLYWSVLEFAAAQKYRYFDFGRSSKDSGTYRFKQQWGAKPRQLYWHYWLRNEDKLPALNPDNPKYSLAIKIWRHMPLSVTNCLGPSIVKYLP